MKRQEQYILFKTGCQPTYYPLGSEAIREDAPPDPENPWCAGLGKPCKAGLVASLPTLCPAPGSSQHAFCCTQMLTPMHTLGFYEGAMSNSKIFEPTKPET
eukprot:801984-Prymnesium_polylepis.1